MSQNCSKDTFSQPWRECIEQAWQAYRAGSLPIGAVIVDKNGRTIAHGRNRLFETSAPAPYLCNGRLAHAEINALLDFGRTTHPAQDATIYTSLEPCPMCLGAIRMHRLGGIAYAAADVVAGSIALANANHFMQHAAFTIHPPPDPAVEQALLTLLAESLLRLTTGGGWLNWREEDPTNRPAMQLGRTLHAQNAYPELIQAESIWQVLSRLVND